MDVAEFAKSSILLSIVNRSSNRHVWQRPCVKLKLYYAILTWIILDKPTKKFIGNHNNTLTLSKPSYNEMVIISKGSAEKYYVNYLWS